MNFDCTLIHSIISFELGLGLGLNSCNQVLNQVFLNPIGHISFLKFLVYFFLTNILESFVYFPYLKKINRHWTRISNLRFILILNFSTHPFVFWILPAIFTYERISIGKTILISETLAILVEGIIIAWNQKKFHPMPFFISFLANAISWNLGTLIMTNI